MKLKTHFFLLVAIAVGLAYPSPAETIREMFGRGGHERPVVSQEDTALTRVRRFERPSHEGPRARFEPQERLVYPCFQDSTYTATVRRVSAGYGNAQVVESQSDDSSVAVISVYAPDGERHEVRDMQKRHVYITISRLDGTLEVQEYNLALQRRFTDDHLPVPESAIAYTSPEPGDTTVIDLMIVMDTRARTWANAHAGGMAVMANAAVARMNLALANSGVPCRIRLVRIYEPDYTYSDWRNGFLPALLQLQSSSGGLRDVAYQRNLYGADVVTMFLDTGSAYGATGMGYDGVHESFAFSVCAIRAVNLFHTMSHEIGHNFGCGHSKAQKDAPGPGLFPYAAGRFFTGTNSRRYHTVMAYNYDGYTATTYTTCDYFSTPRVTFVGSPVGDAEDADNARCIVQTMATVAAYRPPVDFCTLSFNAQSGSVSPTTMDVFTGDPYGALPVPSRAGHFFGGWWTAPNGGGVQITDSTIVTAVGSQTLYANWLKTCTLTLKDGLTDSGASLTNLLSGTVLTIRADDRTQQGFVFDKWTLKPANANLGAKFNPMAITNEIVMPAVNVTLTATYISNPGYLQVYVQPATAQGIRWSRDNGKTWVDALNDGSHYPVKAGNITISFRASHPGWLAPQKQKVKVSTLTTNTVVAVALVPRLIGTFSGRLVDDGDRAGGTLTVTVGANGRTTAKTALTNGTFSLAAPMWSVNAEDAFDIALTTRRGETLTLAFVAEQTGIFPVMTGALTGGALGTGSYSAMAQRDVFRRSKDPDNPAAVAFLEPHAGYYTVLLRPDAIIADGAAENNPEGYGYLGITVNAKKGTAKTTGKLPNGTNLSFSPPILFTDDQLLIPCFSLLHSKHGFYSGLLTFENARVSGDAFWLYPGRSPAAKTPQTEDRFALELATDGGRYSPLTDMPARFVALSPVADEPPVADVPFTIDSAGRIRFPKTSDALDNPQKASFSLAPKTGIFKGKFTLEQNGKNVSVSHLGILAPDNPDALLGAGHYLISDTWTNPLNPKDRYPLKRAFSILITTDE